MPWGFEAGGLELIGMSCVPSCSTFFLSFPVARLAALEANLRVMTHPCR